MADIAKLRDLANKISKAGSPNIYNFAQESVKVAEEHEARLDALEAPPPPPPPPSGAVQLPVGPLETVDGGATQSAGVMNYSTGSIRVEKKSFQNFTSWGVYSMQWPEAVSTGLQEFYDLEATGIKLNPPGSGGGT